MTLKEFYKINGGKIDKAIKDALKEDHIKSDATTNLMLKGKAGNRKIGAALLCKEDCIVAGIDVFKSVFLKIDPHTSFRTFHKDGDWIKKGSKVLALRSSCSTLLRGERTALNFLQRMSGIATLTNYFVKRLKYKDAKLLHTRKTTPNFRIFEAAAVKAGGGDFHRLSLASSVMIKDNHILAAGSVEKVFDILRKEKISPKLKQKFEIEVKTFKELITVVKCGKGLVRVVMIDNFKPVDIKRAITILKTNGFQVEVSGGINRQNFDSFQRKGIDFYSIGMLTHSNKSCDFSLEF
ncbi:MAG: carboxylating nicotinate-nucleotide diphosphorylase [Ignavibacteria bacterium]|nr:carboxylating nicotinate-nucleotide diphosphorylase [Ignavibacteria bacterium]MCC7157990.1 carboxylating nicotinate-nucleotide diphosphorylase [Ignavibacteria bacterium]